MIQRLNFYDLYGYLVPGLLMLLIGGAPFAIFLKRWPAAEWSSAVIVLVVAYAMGHLIQRIGRTAYWTPGGDKPSRRLLRDTHSIFGAEMLQRLRQRIFNRFGVTLPGTGAAEDDAFFLCRASLLLAGKVAYAEQFEGLYALMRGMHIGLVLGAFSYIGVVSAILLGDWFMVSYFVFGGFVALWILDRKYIQSETSIIRRPRNRRNDHDGPSELH
jgi:hypothetical protein